MRLRTLLAAMLLSAAPLTAVAGIQRVPEPETLSLIAIGAVALIIAKTRKRK